MAATSVTIERTYDAPPELVWALLGDTGRFDRAMGMSPPVYRWEVIDGRREHIGRGLQGGLNVEWIEPPYEWIEGRLLHGTRRFIKGPLGHGGVHIEIEAVGSSTRARATMWGDAPHWYMRLIRPIVISQLRRRASAYLEAVGEVLRSGPLPADDGAPAAVRAQSLLAGPTSATTSGSTTPIDHAEHGRRAARLRLMLTGAPVERLIAWLAERPDEDVAQMQPFALARAWNLDRRAVLRAFLHATRAGLVDLTWQINCPVCRVSAGVASSLEGVGRQIHCEACNIAYDVDFGRSVEAVFRCHPAVRAVTAATFCAASPTLRPHVIAQLRVEPGERREQSLPLRHGDLLLRTLGAQRPIERADDAPPAELEVRIGADTVTFSERGLADGAQTKLVLISELDEPCHVVVERGTWASEAVLGSAVASLPEFIELFATEAPAAGLELTVGRLALLFSDLTGSTALYERVGDARAFAIVQEHFRAMEVIVAAHEGAVVKTMGDAVMASFAKTEDAARAALAMVESTSRDHGQLDIGVKLGIHEGPCLAVRANDRLDFFGTTVNVAARLQAQARSSELVVTQEVASSLMALFADRNARRFRAALKGIAAEQDLVGFDLGAATRRREGPEEPEAPIGRAGNAGA